MTQRYFNWRLATVLVVAVVVFGTATFALRHWQRTSHAGQALPLGQAAYAQKDWDEAAKQFGRYLAVNAEDVGVLLKYAEAQQSRQPITTNNLQQAVAAYRAVLRLQRGNSDAVQRLTELYLAMRMPGEAELITKRYLEEREDFAVRRMLAMALAQQRKVPEAVRELNSILAKDPGQIPAYELMGRLAEQRPEDVNKPAAFWFDEAVARNPKSALAYIVRAGYRSQAKKKDFTEALADLEQAQKCDLSDVQVRLRLVGELISANALDQAREHLKALQATNPDESSLWLNWANLAARAGSVEEMRAVAENGLKELKSEPWSFMPTAADLYIRCGRFDEAADCLTRMRQKDVFPARVAFLEGLLAERQGDPRKAAAAWQKALSLDKTLPVPSLPAGTPVMLANMYVRLGDNLSALGQLRAVISVNPASLDAHVALMRLLAQMKQWPEALEEARRVQQLAPGHVEAILLELQATAHALAAAGPGAGPEKTWQAIDERLAQVEKAGANPLQVRLLQAQVDVIRGEFAAAESLLVDLESKYPGQLAILLLHAELYASQGKEQEALARFRDLIEKFPQTAEPVRSLAFYLDRLERRPDSEAAVRQAIERAQDPLLSRDLGLLLADLYRRWGQQDKLYAWLTGLARQFPNDIQLKRQLLTCQPVLQKTQEAQGLVDEIKAIEGDDGWQWRYEQVRVWNAIHYPGDPNQWRSRHYARAVKLLQENLLTSPDDQKSRLLLASIHDRVGEPQMALAVYREALARSPNSVQAIVMLVSALYRVGEFTEAEEILDRARQQGVTNPYVQKLQFQNAYRRGDLTSASDILQGFIDQDPNNMSNSLAMALIRIEEDNYVEAARILDALERKTPHASSVTTARIHLAVRQGNAAEAIRLCDEMIKNLNNAFAYQIRAETYIALQDNEKAFADFEHALALEPKKADLWVARSDRYQALGRIHEAIADIRKAMELSPKNLPIQKRAIALFLQSGEGALVREAERTVDRAIGTNPADQQLRLFRAQILLLKGNNPAIEEARRALQEILDKYPKYADAWEWLARLELQMGESGRAIETVLRGLGHNPEDRRLLLVKALAEKESAPTSAVLTLKGLAEQYPDDLDVLVELADAYVRSGRPEQAVEALRQRVPRLEGRDRRRCEIILAAALYKDQQRDDAKTLFNTLIQAEPDDPAPVVTLAQLLGQEKRWSELNQLIIQWRNRHPDDIATTGALAGALARTGDRDAIQMAENLLRVMLERNPKSVPTMMLLAMLMQSSKRGEEAVALNRRILEAEPNNVIAMNNLAWLLCEEQGQPEEALKIAEKGLRIAPEYADLIDTRGMAHYRLRHLERAVSDFKRCAELYPANLPAVARSRFNLARTLAELDGDKEEARQQLKQVLALCRTYSERGASAESKGLLTQVLDLQNRTGVMLPETAAEAKLLLDQLTQGG